MTKSGWSKRADRHEAHARTAAGAGAGAAARVAAPVPGAAESPEPQAPRNTSRDEGERKPVAHAVRIARRL